MPRFLDVTTRQKLLVVKQLYQHALVQASRKTLTAKLFAVIGFDLAVESLLSTVIVSLDSSKSSADNFPGLLQQCEQVLRKEGIGELPDRAHLLQTHAVRNDAQHRVMLPVCQDTFYGGESESSYAAACAVSRCFSVASNSSGLL